MLKVKAYFPARAEGTARSARTFRIGEGVAGRAAAANSIIHIPDTSLEPQFQSLPGDDTSARAIICAPMIANNNMLQNMHQGIFTILPGRNIHTEYSAFLSSIVETNDIAGMDVMDLMFS